MKPKSQTSPGDARIIAAASKLSHPLCCPEAGGETTQAPDLALPFHILKGWATSQTVVNNARGDQVCFTMTASQAAFIVRACNAYESMRQENARAHESYEGINAAYQQLSDEHAKVLASHAALEAALEQAYADITGYIESNRNKSLGEMRADIRSAIDSAQ